MGLKIYFAGSIRGGRDDAAFYSAMIAFLRTFGEVLTEHVGDPALTEKGDDGPNDRFIHDRDMAWLKRCDLVVAEVTKPSLGVGYELGWAAAWNKPTLCLFRSDSQGTLSAMIAGSSSLETVMYSNLTEAQQHMTAFITHNLPLHCSAQKDGIE
ncbi:nucleoside 2-deoxyribosyltransferase [Deltaproteobacteria bacterium TL4]